tara:strand:- start:2082 stop:2651 length:570 start_codon:yes stop_codon:yes gene_type:complete
MSGQPSVINTIFNEEVWKNNGLLGDIRNTNYPENYYNIFDYKNSPQTDILKNCNTQDQLKGILDETLLSNTFFSVDNIKNIQDMIRYYFFQEKNELISEQNNNELLTIMRGIYLKYSNSAANTIDTIKEEVRELNKIVVEYSLKQIYINYDNYNRYINDLEKLPTPLDLPKVPEKPSYTYNLSRGEDFA